MKIFAFFVLLFLILISLNSLAQTPWRIENELYKSYKKIDFWLHNRNDYAADSLVNANSAFGKKLKYYTSKYPLTIDQKFSSLKKEHLGISTSSDGLLRIYSWDTWTGGTMHFFDNVFQYKTGDRTHAFLDTPKSQGDIGTYFQKLYTFNNNSKIYYLGVFMFIESSRFYGGGVQIFSIQNGKLNRHVELIKTEKGLADQLNYEYDFGSLIDWKVRPEISFDAASKTIKLPLTAANGTVTHKYILYKFTGRYFEKVKN